MVFEPSEIDACSELLPSNSFCSVNKQLNTSINCTSRFRRRHKSQHVLPNTTLKLTMSSSLLNIFVFSSFVILSLLPLPVTAFTKDAFEEHAHKHHKDFVIRADDWVKQSEVECQHRFEYERWPCNLDDHFVIISANGSGDVSRTREAAFVQALTAASMISHSLALCFDGSEPVNCDCSDESETRYATDTETDEADTFVKCSEQYIKYATRVFGKFRKSWLAGKNEDEDLMLNHNAETGRRTLLKGTFTKCACHGMSGSCSSKICWEELPHMRMVSAALKSKYNNERLSVKTEMLDVSNTKPKLITLSRNLPPKNNLVYLSESPSYCEYVENRSCTKDIPITYDSTEDVPEWEIEHRERLIKSCNHLCSGCGYDILKTQKTIRDEECECVFEWCCFVNCTSCELEITLYSCQVSSDYYAESTKLDRYDYNKRWQ